MKAEGSGFMRRVGVAAAFALFCSLFIATAPASQAAVGDVSYVECLGGALLFDNDACDWVPGLGYASSAAISPDGTSLYTVGTVLTVWHRDRTTGALTHGACYGTQDPCTPLTGYSGGIVHMVVSPDGLNLYAAVPDMDRVVAFSRNRSDGTLGFVGCVEDVSKNSGLCTRLKGLDYPQKLAVTEQGDSNVYVANVLSYDILWFRRSPTTGGLGFEGCAADANGHSWGNCRPVPGLGMPWSVAVSPDGIGVYSGSYNSLIAFDRSSTSGSLTTRTCHENQKSASDTYDGPGLVYCLDTPGLSYIRDIAISPDSRSIYTLGTASEAIGHFLRAQSTSELNFYRCQRDVRKALNGCDGVIYIAGPTDIEVTKDANSLYVTGSASRSLAMFRRNLTQAGRLDQTGCFLDNSNTGDGCTHVDGLDGATSLSISPESNSIYVAAYDDGALARFSREAAPPPAPDTIAPETTITQHPRSRTTKHNATFAFTSNESSVHFVCKLDKHPAQYCTTPKTWRRLATGRHRLEVYAKDEAGNRDASPAVVTWKVL